MLSIIYASVHSYSFILYLYSFLTYTNKHKLISKVCEFLICYNSRDEDGNTPVHTCARYGNLKAAKLFLDWQCMTQGEEKLELVRNFEGKIPAHLAAEFGHLR